MQRAFVVIVLLLATVPCAAAPVSFGAMGDSLTDEYSFWGPLAYNSPSALGWVDQLALFRSSEVNFGSYAAWDPIVFPGGPRYVGYEYNYARLGATTTTLLSEGQHTGVLSQPVDIVYLGIGTNDFTPADDAFFGTPLGLVDNYSAIYAGGDPTAVINNLVTNFVTALEAVAGPPGSPTGVQVIIGNVGDWGVMPLTTAVLGFTDPPGRANVTAAIIAANAQILEIAQARGIPVVDVFSLLNLALGPDPLVVGDFAINAGSPPSDDQSYFFLPDDIHPGTIWQGLLANTILSAANRHYAGEFTLFSDQELLSAAGLPDPNGGNVTSYFDVSDFVEPMPEPSTLSLLVLGVLPLAAVRRRAS